MMCYFYIIEHLNYKVDYSFIKTICSSIGLKKFASKDQMLCTSLFNLQEGFTFLF